MPLMKGSQPMKPTSLWGSACHKQMLAGAEADLEPDIVNGHREQLRQLAGGLVLRSSRRRGNSSPISRSFRALNGLAFRLP